MFFKIIRKTLSFFHFLILKFYYFKKIKTIGISFFNFYSHVSISEKGSLKINNNSYLDKKCEIKSEGGFIEIGTNFYMNSFSRIISKNKIIIGNSVRIAQFVTILDHDHNYFLNEKGEMVSNGYVCDEINIGNNVFIGDKCTILKGVSIGNNVKIASNSVVNKNIKSNSIVAGIPAKQVKVII
jgi:acetyltransferase-like isoleucine patch superfamily enzyme